MYRTIPFSFICVGVAGLLSSCPARAKTVQAGPYRLQVTLSPVRATVRGNVVRVSVFFQGKPLSGARLLVHPVMSSMPMVGTDLRLVTNQAGAAEGPLRLAMSGAWKLQFTVKGSVGSGRATVPLTTGQNFANTSSGSATSSLPLSPPGSSSLQAVGTGSTVGLEANGVPTPSVSGNGVQPSAAPPALVPSGSKSANGGAPNRQGQQFPLATPGGSNTENDKATPNSQPGNSMAVDAAVRLGLSNNPDLLSALQELGIANATVIQAGIVSNPVVAGQYRFANDRRFSNYWEASVTENILDLVLRGARVELAQTQLAAARARLQRVLFQQATLIKSAYYRVQADQQELRLSQTMQEAADAAAELAQRQRQAGNLSQLDLIRQQAVQSETSAQLLEVQGQLAVDRQTLRRLLGQPGNGDETLATDSLSLLPDADPEPAELHRLAQANRQELVAARLDLRAARQGESLSGQFFGVDDVRLGVFTAHEVEGVQTTGPVLQFPLAFSNQNGGVRARYQAQGKVAALSERVAQLNADYEVDQAYQKLQTARKLVDTTQRQVIPLRHQALELAKQQFNNMFLGIYGLLTIYREELDSQKRLVEGLAAYWSARAELEKAAGVDLPVRKGEK